MGIKNNFDALEALGYNRPTVKEISSLHETPPEFKKNKMKTQVPKIKTKNDELQIEGDFNFKLSPTIITEDSIPIRKITFDWCVEIPQEEMMKYGEDNILEMFGEKLKQDFIKLSKQKF